MRSKARHGVPGVSTLLLVTLLAGCGGGGGSGNGNDNSNDNGNGGGGGGGGAGLVVGRVSTVGGEPIANAAVTLSVGRSSTTDENGFFSFEDFDPGQPVVARFSASGFAGTSKSLTAAGRDTATPACVFLADAGEPVMIDADQGSTQRAGDSVVTFEAGALVGTDGSAVSGMVQLTATYVDPSGDAVMAFPGSFDDAAMQSGDNVTLESFGFAIYELTQNGEDVELAPGQTAVIEYVLPANSQDQFAIGDTIGLWEFDEDTAMWMQAGQGEIRAASDGSGRLAWFAEVDHFSAWNCDAPIAEKHSISGRVIFDGGPVNGAEVTAVGLSYNGTTTTRTDMDGTFCLDVKRGSTVRLEVRVNGAATPVFTQLVTVPDAASACPSPGVDVGDIAVDFDACVSGRVTNDDGSPAAGVRVYLVPGETVITSSDGSYCGAAAAGAEVAVFAEGRPSVSVTASSPGSCGGACAEANLTFALPEAGDQVGWLYASADRFINPSFGDFEGFSLSASFYIFNSQFGGSDQSFSIPGYEFQTQQIGECTVTTQTITYDTTGEGQSFSGLVAFGALDPGDPGRATSGGVGVDLLRGNPNEFDPPQPQLAGVFSPAEDPQSLLELGFSAGQSVNFSFPGGADIGAFDGSIDLPESIDVTSPDLEAADFEIDTTAALPLTWDRGQAGEEIVVTISGSRFENAGTTSTTITAATIRCVFPDDGSATVPAAAMALLPADSLSTSLTVARTRQSQVQVPLNRVFGSGVVHLFGQVSVSRSTFELPDVPDACDFVNCPEGQTCNTLTGVCESADGTDLCSGVVCPIGEFCDQDTGQCGPLDFCDFITCPDGTECNPETFVCE